MPFAKNKSERAGSNLRPHANIVRSGDISAEIVNGDVELEGVSGNVNGRAVNGSIEVALVGDRLAGEGVTLVTVNGPVKVRMPEGFSARLELETVSGGMDVDFPITISGQLGRSISTTLGGGGPSVRVETTGGAIRVGRYRADATGRLLR